MNGTETTLYDTVDSPLGELLLVGDGRALTGLFMLPEHRHAPSVGADWRRDRAAFAEATRQLKSYFAGELTEFELPLDPRGTAFQRQVWGALRDIPYGRTVGYAQLAAAVGRPGAARAVGAANGRNPISIVIPCHRVIGSGGALTGYGGGLERKRSLLALEAASRTYTLIGADAVPYQSSAPGTLGDRRRSRPACAVCMPERYAEWKGAG